MAVTTVAATDSPRGQGAGKPPPKRRWPHRILLGLNIFVAVCVLAAGAVYGYVWWRFGEINRVNVPSLFGGSGGGGAPETILVVGSDSRAFVDDSADAQSFGSAAQTGGARSDTTMLVRLDPKAGTATILSIPRDMWVPIAGTNYSQRINTAFDSGPDVLVRTIQDDFGIQINHYVDLDFATFRDVVNALGGVKFWYPEPVHDTYSGLNITTPGCYTLTGDMALSLVRARHMTYEQDGRWLVEGESDLARIRRQQLFVKSVVSKAQSQGLGSITSINGVVGGIVSHLTVDSGFSQKDMLRLVRVYRHFNPDNIATMTMPNTAAVIGGADVLLPIKDQDVSVINTFLGQSTPSSPSTTTAPVNLTPAQVTVHVLNGSGRPGEATRTTSDLRTLGYQADVSGNGNADNFSYQTTVVKYGPSGLAAAQTLAASIIGGSQLQPDSALTGSAVEMITGQSYAGVHTPSAQPAQAAAPAAPQVTATTVPANSSQEPAFPGTHGTDPPPPGSGCSA